MSQDPARIPVIIGVGEINDRPDDPMDGLDSVELMAASAKKADVDAGGGWIEQCDWLTNVAQMSFRTFDVEAMLPKALGIKPATVVEAKGSYGDHPVMLVNDAANAIASGKASVCIVTGGEGLRTAAKRPKKDGGGEDLFRKSRTSASDVRQRYGMIEPAQIYPLYENATRAAWGLSLAQAQAETGKIWSTMSQVANDAEGAWIKQPRTPEEITTFDANNRPLAFPYSKFQVANSSVNQGASLIITSLAKARAAGIDEGRIIYIGAGANAHEDEEPLNRVNWTGTVAMEVALEKTMELNGLAANDLDHVELYSCFPCVPKMARRILGLSADRPLSVQGGLTFGGGPMGNYMMHASAGMVRKLRESGEYGLLYGNGGHCTHNHAIVLSTHPVKGVSFPQDYDFHEEADARRGAIPESDQTYEGPATIETYTVFHSRAGDPTSGVIFALTPQGTRVVSKVEGEDLDMMAFLTDGTVEPVGTSGRTERVGETLFWRR
ncbi:MAG: acetyl-CoA acetyltransferase [Sphingomonadaceae bacterium]|nr:acetyl-CoA acetyltransferase [Sphingomonadaceae bacterium]